MSKNYATVDDVITLGRPITEAERSKTEALIATVSAYIRERAKLLGKDFDAMLKDEQSGETDEDLELLAKEVVVRAVLRALNASTTDEAATQITESAGGYSQTLSPLVPGGGVFIRKSEWKSLGLSRQYARNVELI